MRTNAEKMRFGIGRLKGDLLFTTASLVASAVAFQGTIIAARCLAPHEFGVMQTTLLLPTYCAFLPFGVFNGLNRNIPFHLGRKDQNKVQEMVNSSWTVAKIVSVLGALISLGFSIYYISSGRSSIYFWGMAAVFIALIAEPFSQHAEIVYMGTQKFRSLGARVQWQNLISGCGNMLPAVAGVPGFVASRCIFTLARLMVRLPGMPIEPRGNGSMLEVKDLAITGAPLLIAGVIYGYLGVADRSVIACFLSSEEMGQYTLTGLVVSVTQLIPLCLASLFYPRLSAQYGRTGSPRSLRRYFWILLGANAAVVLPVCAVMYFALGPLTSLYLPKYVDGVPAARIACLSSLTFTYIGVAGVIAVIRRNTPYIVALAASLVLVWGLGTYLVTSGYGIVGAVWARTIAGLLLCIFTIGYAYWLTSQEQP